MAKDSKVFRLIKELSMSEKRHFKIFAEKHVIGEQNNYIILFNTLDKEVVEDDDKILKKLEKKNYPTNYISADKNYLYQLILKSLTHFHAGRNTKIQVRELLIQTEILYQKGLYDQCTKLVQKATKLSDNLEDPQIILECNNWIRKVMGPLIGAENVYDTISEAKQIAQHTVEELDYLDLYYQTFILREKINRSRDGGSIEKLEELMSHDLLTKSKPESLFATVKYHQTWAQYYYIHSNHEDEYKHCNELIAAVESNKFFMKNYPFDYLAHKSRQLSVAKFADQNTFLQLLKEFRKLDGSNYTTSKERYNFQIEYYASMSELAFHVYQGNYESLHDRIEKIRKDLEQFDRFLNNSAKVTFHYLFAYVYVAVGNPKQALKEINTILNDFKVDDRPDLFHFARLMNLIIHFELENVSLIPYLHKSTENFFKKNNSLYPFENLIMKFFKNVTEDKNSKKLREDLEKLLAKMNELKVDSTNTAASLYFNIEKWIESKVKSTTMSEL